MLLIYMKFFYKSKSSQSTSSRHKQTLLKNYIFVYLFIIKKNLSHDIK